MGSWSQRCGLVLLAAAGSVGCQPLCEFVNDTTIAVRERYLLLMAWRNAAPSYGQCYCLGDFASGYRAGYENVLEGGRGCPPAVPPQNYWCGCCENDTGQQRMYAWFDGFRHGAFAAQQSGCAGYNRLATTSSLHRVITPAPQTQTQPQVDVLPVPPPGPPPTPPPAPPPAPPAAEGADAAAGRCGGPVNGTARSASAASRSQQQGPQVPPPLLPANEQSQE